MEELQGTIVEKIGKDREYIEGYIEKAAKITIEEVERGGEKQTRGRVPAIMTELKVDSYGEVVKPMGVQLDRFKKNPVVINGHQSYMGVDAVLGQVDIDSIVQTEKRLSGDMLFNLTKIPGTDNFQEPKAAETFFKFQSRALRAVSIGFRSVDISKEPILPKQKGVTHTKSILLELSPVPIGALDTALAQFKSAMTKDDKMDFLRKIITPELSTDDRILIENALIQVREDTKDERRSLDPTMENAINKIQFETEFIQKAGKILSNANETALRDAANKINGVLAKLQPPEEPDKDDGKDEKKKPKDKKQSKPNKAHVVGKLNLQPMSNKQKQNIRKVNLQKM